ncbi:MAG: hypothetical protein C5B49_16005 [Bdellovibrio sp.]|nr:MAG: hypothetical protein C5B49_16005 [Bdellovibrio sp.]
MIKWLREQVSVNSTSLVYLLSLVVIRDHFVKPWYTKISVEIFFLIGILFPPARLHRDFWFLFLAVAVCSLVFNYEVLDNHKFFMAIWIFTLWLASMQEEGERTRDLISTSARYLIGLVMFFSVLWKFLSHDFLNGQFFEGSLLIDERFRVFASLISGISVEGLNANTAGLERLHEYGNGITTWPLNSNLSIRLAAKALTWWTLGIEGAIAVLFLLPFRSSKMEVWRNGVLLFFCLTTYSIATVKGFAWILLTMGFAQCSMQAIKTRWAYIAVIFLLVIYQVPYGDVVRESW